MSARFNFIFSLCLSVLCFGSASFAQTPVPTPNVRTPAVAQPQASPSPTPVRTTGNSSTAAAVTAEQIAEAAIFIYGLGLGRQQLNQIRKSTTERGKTTFTAADGKKEVANYQRYMIRGATLDKDKVRLDQEFPNARYSLIYSNDQMFGLLNRTRFDPTDEAAASYESSIFRGPEMLLRYKENGSKLALAGKEKELGVEMHMVDVTDKKGRTARFHVSVKSYRILAISYDVGGVKYKRKYYNHNFAQGTLVPYRSVLLADGKVIEETEISTITFGQRVEEDLFVG